MTSLPPNISNMTQEDIAAAVSLVGRAMNPLEAQYALESFERHFAVEAFGIDDGRKYFIAGDRERLIGISGLHHWAWGPRENVWLGWFAINPDTQGMGIGTWLLAETEKKAAALGFQKLFVETYDHPDFKRAITFYMERGFQRAGGIDEWLPGGEDMIVLAKKL